MCDKYIRNRFAGILYEKPRLTTMFREYASISKLCMGRTNREKQAAEKRIKKSQFPVIKSIDKFDFKDYPSINEQLVRALMLSEYIAKDKIFC